MHNAAEIGTEYTGVLLSTPFLPHSAKSMQLGKWLASC